MCEPLSITVGVLSILKVCTDVGIELKKFHNNVKNIDETANDLIDDVSSLVQMLEAMKHTFDQAKNLSSVNQTGHIGQHWRNLSRALEDGEKTLTRLGHLLQSVNKEAKFLDGPRKVMRLNNATGQLNAFKAQIQGSRDVLSLSMQTLILWNQFTLQESSQGIIPSLEQLTVEVRRIATYLNPQIRALELTMDISQASELDHARHLRECVRSSASIISSTSTTITEGRGDGNSLVADSDFGDCLLEPPNEHMIQWIASNTIDEENSVTNPQLYHSQAPGSPMDFVNDSDSDSDLEGEMTRALLRSGEEKFAAEDYQSAERLLKSCNSRLSLVSSPSVPASSSKDTMLKLQVLKALHKLYIKQERWEQAQIVVTERISLAQSYETGGNTAEALEDVLWLAKILIKRQSYTEAHLQARRAFKGFKKLGAEGNIGAEEALKVLIRICEIEGKLDEREAYQCLLSEFSQRITQPTAAPSVPPSTISPEVAGFLENVSPGLNAGEEKLLQAPSGHTSPRSSDLRPEAVSLSTDPASSEKEIGNRPWVSPIGQSSAQPASDTSAQAPLVSSVGSLPLNLSNLKKMQSLNDQLTYPAQQSLSKSSDLAGEPLEISRTRVSALSTSGKTQPQKKLNRELPRYKKTQPQKKLNMELPRYKIPRFKIVLIGSSRAGKSHLISRYLFDEYSAVTPPSLYFPRIIDMESNSDREGGAVPMAECDKLELQPRELLGESGAVLTASVDSVQLQLHELGSSDFNELSARGVDFIMICFSIDNRESFNNVQRFLVPKVQSCAPEVSYMLVGCKRDIREDMPESQRRCITYDEGKNLADKINARRYFECSARTSWGVTELFRVVAWLAWDYRRSNPLSPPPKEPPSKAPPKKKKWRGLFSLS